MNIGSFIHKRVLKGRKPDFTIGRPNEPYMLRWWVIPRNRWFNIYLHHFLHSDEDRALHDHPWWSMTFVLDGGYWEHTARQSGEIYQKLRNRFGIVFRRAKTAHRVELREHRIPLTDDYVVEDAWTLFFTGPVVREWGFHCPKGWMPWHKFVKTDNPGEVGKGCDQ